MKVFSTPSSLVPPWHLHFPETCKFSFWITCKCGVATCSAVRASLLKNLPDGLRSPVRARVPSIWFRKAIQIYLRIQRAMGDSKEGQQICDPQAARFRKGNRRSARLRMPGFFLLYRRRRDAKLAIYRDCHVVPLSKARRNKGDPPG